jgi:hypothetical protein
MEEPVIPDGHIERATVVGDAAGLAIALEEARLSYREGGIPVRFLPAYFSEETIRPGSRQSPTAGSSDVSSPDRRRPRRERRHSPRTGSQPSRTARLAHPSRAKPVPCPTRA